MTKTELRNYLEWQKKLPLTLKNILDNSNLIEMYFTEMNKAIIDCLSKLAKGYGMRKWAIEKETGIPLSTLTVLLKQLKIDRKVELIMLWSETTGMPDGSGYCLTGNLN